MKFTKFEHSCFTVELQDQFLVVDPGAWTSDFDVPANVKAIVVTHEHADHFDPSKLQAIIDQNPNTTIYAPEAVTSQLTDFHTRTISAGDTVNEGPFNLEFFGGTHATIHAEYHDPFQNIGVYINERIYHPGDSLVLPHKPVHLLSLPIVAPWEKVSESVDFLMAVRPTVAVPTHDAFLNERGAELYDRWHKLAAEKIGAHYQRMASKETLDV